MPAVKQINRELIVAAATGIVRKSGMDALNARALAAELGCSTRPIYLSFPSMDALKAAVTAEITRIYQGYLREESERHVYPPYKAFGMGYIGFAREEKQLFRYLFMRDRSSEPKGIDGGDVGAVIEALMGSTGFDRKTAERFHLESWLYVHGIGSALATGYLDLDEQTVSDLLTDMFLGLKARFADSTDK